MPKAKAAAQRALDLDPELAAAEATLAFVAMMWDRDWEESRRRFERALELEPNNVIANYWYAYYFAWVEDRPSEALVYAKRAVDLDPASPHALNALGSMYMNAGEVEVAISTLVRALELQRSWTNLRVLGLTLHWQGRSRQALPYLEEAVEISRRQPFVLGDLAGALAAIGDERAEELYRELQAGRKDGYVNPAILGMVALDLGREEEAGEWFDLAYEEHDPFLGIMRMWKGEPKARMLRHARLQEIYRKMGLR